MAEGGGHRIAEAPEAGVDILLDLDDVVASLEGVVDFEAEDASRKDQLEEEGETARMVTMVGS